MSNCTTTVKDNKDFLTVIVSCVYPESFVADWLASGQIQLKAGHHCLNGVSFACG